MPVGAEGAHGTRGAFDSRPLNKFEGLVGIFVDHTSIVEPCLILANGIRSTGNETLARRRIEIENFPDQKLKEGR